MAKMAEARRNCKEPFPFNDALLTEFQRKSRTVKYRLPWSFETEQRLSTDVRKLYNNFNFKNKATCIQKLILNKAKMRKEQELQYLEALQRYCIPQRLLPEAVPDEGTQRTQERHSSSVRSAGQVKAAVNSPDDPVVVHRFELDVPTDPHSGDRQSPQPSKDYLPTDGTSDILSPLHTILAQPQ